MPPLCSSCNLARPAILRPKNRDRLCPACFITTFEDEVHETISTHNLFPPYSRIAIGASGGKDSTVLASVLHTINVRHNYHWELVLLSIDEGIKGYRDDSLGAVEWLGRELGLRWKVVGYRELYGWTMDQVVEQIGKKGNCTYCGVWRRQALDRGVGFLDEGVDGGANGKKKGGWRLCTGHNADDVAETVVMNLLRGDTPRLSRCTHITTSTPTAAPGSSATPVHTFVSRSKPLMYAYEKEIVLYAHHRRLTYFSTECIYSPEAFRGSARALIKDLERVRPEAILDLGRAGAVLGACVPGAEAGKEEVGEVVGACGKGGIISGVVAEEPAVKVDANNDEEKNELETEVTLASLGRISLASKDSILEKQPSSKDQAATTPLQSKNGRRRKQNFPPLSKKSLVPGQQTMGQCIRCGYLTSQDVCKACVLLEGLNRNRPKVGIGISVSGDDGSGGDVDRESDETRGVGRRKLAGEAVLEVS